jgi:arylsulfatase A-like enzyme
MTREIAPKKATSKAVRITQLMRLVSAALLLVGLGLYLKQSWRPSGFVPIPIQPLVLSPERPSVPSLPAESGSLAGQNLILVTLDTTRADRIGFYGNDEIETPNLDLLASKGVSFTKAVATAPATLPAHASILTGLYPHHHGVRANLQFRVGKEQQTLAEVLSGNGYETAAFVSSIVLDEGFGLDQGFGVYDDHTALASGDTAFPERRGNETTDRAISWMRANSKRPFFLWVHYYDPHTTYEPPDPFASQYKLAYDGEIAFVDQQFGRLIEAVESLKGPETFVVVTSDHGEALGEHGETAHGYLVQEATIQIPLIMYSKRGLQGGIHVDSRASQVDLMPTILPLLGIATPEGLDGVNLALPPDLERAVMATTLEGRVEYGWARLSALYEGRWKIVDGPRPELYDLSTDPIGHVDLSTTKPGELLRLQGRLNELRGTGSDLFVPSDNDLDWREIEQLKALGYVVGGEAGKWISASGPGPDPREMIPLLTRVAPIANAPDRADAIRKLEVLASEHSDFAPIHLFLSILYELEYQSEKASRARARLRAIIRSAEEGQDAKESE